MGSKGPHPWHAIYGYPWDDLPTGVGPWHWHSTLEAALLEALDWSKLPLLVADICPMCRNMGPGPHTPRWNIYRGPDWGAAPPCWFWDVVHGEWPPPPPHPPPW